MAGCVCCDFWHMGGGFGVSGASRVWPWAPCPAPGHRGLCVSLEDGEAGGTLCGATLVILVFLFPLQCRMAATCVPHLPRAPTCFWCWKMQATR